MAVATTPSPAANMGKIGGKWPSAKHSRPILFRKWVGRDVLYASVMLFVHVLCLFAPYTFSWGAFWVGFIHYVTSGLLGVGMCFHRYLAHGSFKLPKPLEYLFAYLGLLMIQGDPLYWVSAHRNHHKFADTPRDPHSPGQSGLAFSHLYWIIDWTYLTEKCGGYENSVADMNKQWFYRFLDKTVVVHVVLYGYFLYLYGGFPYLVWGMGVPTVWVYHSIFTVNSVGHTWGRQSWDSGDSSRNNWFIALFTFGEGWHNNHHAFETSARHGLEWWEFDSVWYFIKLLEILGLATNVKVPSETRKKKLRLETDNYGPALIKEQKT